MSTPTAAGASRRSISSDLTGRPAIVTGAGGGIGSAVARLLAAYGAPVVVADLDMDAAGATCETIASDGGNAIATSADVTDVASVEEMVGTCVEAFGSLSIAVNNAAIREDGEYAVADYPVDLWNAIVTTNLTSVFLCMRAEIPAMRAAGGGSIVNMASIMGRIALPGIAGYTAAKHGVVGLTKTAALDHATDGIRVNAVGPGLIRTPMIAALADAVTEEYLASHHALGRLGTPEEVAALVAWLAGDGASFATGGFYPVDGGFKAQG